MPSRTKSSRSAGLKRLQSHSFTIDDDICDEIQSLGEFVNSDAILVVQQTGEEPSAFECRVEVCGGKRSGDVVIAGADFFFGW